METQDTGMPLYSSSIEHFVMYYIIYKILYFVEKA